mgnify:CR=1 FL=1
MKKYIVIDTWNGEGYSSENGTQIKIFDNEIDAQRYAELEAQSQLALPVSARLENEKVTIHQENGITSFCYEIGRNGYEDHGSYQVHEIKRCEKGKFPFAVMIKPNINEAEILTLDEYLKTIESLELDFKCYYGPAEKEDYFYEGDHMGDLFVSCFGDHEFDYQFRNIKNI